MEISPHPLPRRQAPRDSAQWVAAGEHGKWRYGTDSPFKSWPWSFLDGTLKTGFNTSRLDHVTSAMEEGNYCDTVAKGRRDAWTSRSQPRYYPVMTTASSVPSLHTGRGQATRRPGVLLTWGSVLAFTKQISQSLVLTVLVTTGAGDAHWKGTLIVCPRCMPPLRDELSGTCI